MAQSSSVCVSLDTLLGLGSSPYLGANDSYTFLTSSATRRISLAVSHPWLVFLT